MVSAALRLGDISHIVCLLNVCEMFVEQRIQTRTKSEPPNVSLIMPRAQESSLDGLNRRKRTHFRFFFAILSLSLDSMVDELNTHHEDEEAEEKYLKFKQTNS